MTIKYVETEIGPREVMITEKGFGSTMSTKPLTQVLTEHVARMEALEARIEELENPRSPGFQSMTSR